jgi:ubiquinone/menaquinone biosynthesis C-methylase UbiE
MALTTDSVSEFAKYVDKNARVLEVGCGDGFALNVLKKLNFTGVTGCDINPEKIGVAVRHGHAVSVQDAHQLGFQSSRFAAVYCAHTLEHTYDGPLALKEIYRVLIPGGLVFIIVPDHTGLYGEISKIADFIPSFEKRDIDYFERLAFKRSGRQSDFPRNQYPMTMKLLLRKVIDSGFEVQTVSRILRDGPELWLIATKPISGTIPTESIIVREYCKRNHLHEIFQRIIRRIFNAFCFSS